MSQKLEPTGPADRNSAGFRNYCAGRPSRRGGFQVKSGKSKIERNK